MNKKAKELNRINNSLDKQISSENKEAFTDMICYLRGANISAYDQEVVRQDLTEMVLSAQQRGETICSVIGEDYKAFCDNIIASLPPETARQKVIDFFDILCWALSILGAINIVMADETIHLIHDLITGRPLGFRIPISLGSVISAGFIIVAAIVIVEIFMKKSFEIGKRKQTDRLNAVLISSGFMVVLLLIAWFGRATLFTVNIFIACAAVLALYIIHKILANV
ncbi:hypothetical protein OBV_19220 [Oscillibacter valericigenes Sjm18-20]|nr:hypothetical protein OBV_19220 [Oscillibacter valericigenes Sjm18-20]